jgi:hypothetical protein
MNKLIEIILKRLKSDSPELFKKTGNYAFWLGIAATLLLMLPLNLPGWAVSLITLFAGLTTGVAGTSRLTVNDKSTPDEKKDKIPRPDKTLL